MNLIYKQQDLIELFDDISPFNMKKDIKFLNKQHIDIDKILQDIEATLYTRNYDVIYERVKCNEDKKETILVKVRIKNPQNNRGESSGFRIVAIVNECEDFAIVINIFPKTGSERKDDLTQDEESKAKDLYKEVIE